MIARDREAQLRAALSSIAKHVDEIVVVDAGGSSDRTQDVARSYGARVIEFLPKDHPEAFYLDVEERFARYKIPGPYSGRQALADFSAPRNLSFTECKGDYIFWLDSDDIVRGAEHLRGVVEKMEEKAMECAFFQYEYERDALGNCTVRQIRERIIRRSDFVNGKVRWHQPIHEHLKGMRKGGLFEEVVIVHDTVSTTKDSNSLVSQDIRINTVQRDRVHFRNLKNLLIETERAKASNEELDPRIEFYLGSEYRSIDLDLSEKYLTSYIARTSWDEERAQARYYIGQVREMQMRGEEAWNHYAGAAMDFPQNPAAWFGLARIAFLRGDWNKTVEFSEKGFAQVGDDVARKPALILNPLEWKYRAHLPYSRALIEIGRIDDARKSCETGLAVEPKCRFLNEHMRMIREREGKEQAA
jgi:glycosyltransferase involved in cell wall biosynthesis